MGCQHALQAVYRYHLPTWLQQEDSSIYMRMPVLLYNGAQLALPQQLQPQRTCPSLSDARCSLLAGCKRGCKVWHIRCARFGWWPVLVDVKLCTSVEVSLGIAASSAAKPCNLLPMFGHGCPCGLLMLPLALPAGWCPTTASFTYPYLLASSKSVPAQGSGTAMSTAVWPCILANTQSQVCWRHSCPIARIIDHEVMYPLVGRWLCGWVKWVRSCLSSDQQSSSMHGNCDCVRDSCVPLTVRTIPFAILFFSRQHGLSTPKASSAARRVEHEAQCVIYAGSSK